MIAYRQALRSSILSAAPINDSGGTSNYAARPTMSDFKCDVEKVIEKCVKDRALFELAYVFFDSEDPIEREVYADKIIGESRHNLEQGMGAEFLRRKLDKGYFTSIRKEHYV